MPRLKGGLDEKPAVPSERAARPEAASSVAPVASGYEHSLRPCLGTTIAPQRRALSRQALLAHRGDELAGDRLRGGRARGDHEAGVVAGEGADDLRVLQPIERAGDRGSRAELGLDDDDVLRRGGAHAELLEHGVQRLARIAAGAAAGHHVAGPPELVARLLEPELPDVARDGCLRDLAARFGQRLRELELAPNPLSRDDARDQALPL